MVKEATVSSVFTSGVSDCFLVRVEVGRPSGGRCVPAVLLPAGGVGAGGAEGPEGAGGVLNFS